MHFSRAFERRDVLTSNRREAAARSFLRTSNLAVKFYIYIYIFFLLFYFNIYIPAGGCNHSCRERWYGLRDDIRFNKPLYMCSVLFLIWTLLFLICVPYMFTPCLCAVVVVDVVFAGGVCLWCGGGGVAVRFTSCCSLHVRTP